MLTTLNAPAARVGTPGGSQSLGTSAAGENRLYQGDLDDIEMYFGGHSKRKSRVSGSHYAEQEAMSKKGGREDVPE